MGAAHRHRTSEKVFGLVALAVLAFGTLSIGAVSFSRPDLPFADDHFADLWTRTDAPAVRANRTLYWGETPWWSYAEFYRQASDGLRTVQYFDKGRMELSNSSDNQPVVTSGLLVKELVSGHVQLGDRPADSDPRQRATIPVVGDLQDNPDAPTYATFAVFTTIDNTYRNSKRLGLPVDTTLDAQGDLGSDLALATAATTIAQYDQDTGHNIPTIFWQFAQQRGLVQTGSQVSNGVLSDWLATLGHPISDAYWVRARVGGVERDVLVQLFERRVLTYTPGNPAGYEVEFGNVGQHYVSWRYPQLGEVWAAPVESPTLVYATEHQGWSLRQWTAKGGTVALDNAPAGLLPSSVRRAAGATPLIVGDTTASDGEHRQVYAFDVNGETQRLTYSDGTRDPSWLHAGALPHGAANEYAAAVSPDGSKIAFISDRSGTPELFLMPFGGGNPVQLTSSDCASATPTWSSDGRRLLWVNNCDGDDEIYSAALSYDEDDQAGLNVALGDVQKLTNNSSADRFPSVSPDGAQVVFVSNRDGHDQLYTMQHDGSKQTVLLTSDSHDTTPSWSPDGSTIAFTSDRTGGDQVFTLNVASGAVKQISDGSLSAWPVWLR